MQRHPAPVVTLSPGYCAAHVTVCNSASMGRPLTSALSRQVREIAFAPSDAVSFDHMFNGVTLRASEVWPTHHVLLTAAAYGARMGKQLLC